MPRKIEVAPSVAYSLAKEFMAHRQMNPDATLDGYLKDIGITMNRDSYVEAAEAHITPLGGTRVTGYEESAALSI